MIYCDRDIEKAIRDGRLMIDPVPELSQFDSTSVNLRVGARLAARVEGRSKQARLGLTAHITAPIIHSGFSGKITLEILNHGPFELKVRPSQSRLCQLIIEEVKSVPRRSGSLLFSQQSTPLGTPRRRN